MAVDINIDDLTTGSVDGTGTFDKMMATVAAQLDDQFKKNRINASDYAKIYTQLIQATMQSAIQFELGRELAAAQASLVIQQEANAVKEGELIDAQRLDVLAATDLKEAELLNVPKQGLLLDSQKLQVDAQTSNVKAELLNIPKQGVILDQQASNLEAEKLRIDAQVDSLEAELLNIPKQGLILDSQKSQIDAEILNIPKQGELLDQQKTNLVSEELRIDAQTALLGSQKLTEDAQKLKVTAETSLTTQQTTNAATQNTVLASQKTKLDSEKQLLDQKKVTEEAQTKDTAGGLPVVGVIGKQKELYAKQAEGFIRDAEQKAAKIVSDAYSVRKSAESTATTPTSLNDTSIDTVVNKMKQGIGVV